MARLFGCNLCQTGDGASDELETYANGRDCQCGTRTNEANHEKMKIQKSRGQIWSSGAEQRFYTRKKQTKRGDQAKKNQKQPKRQDKLQSMSL